MTVSKTTEAENIYRLEVVQDDFSVNPRIDYDNLGTMVCWHNRYDLGDKHEFSEPSEFLKQLVSDTLSADEVIRFIKNDGCDTVKFEYDSIRDSYILKDKDLYSNKWFYGYTFSGDELDGSELAKDAVLEVLPPAVLKELADRKNIILPLYLYDHSGITISCDHTYPYNDRWDAGQVGWVYVSHDDVQREYGIVNSETIAKAKQVLIGETKDYDHYLQGECYGYVIEKNGVEVGSCWGYLGDLRDMISDMKSSVPDEYQHLFDHIDYLHMEYMEDENTKNAEHKPSIHKQLSAHATVNENRVKKKSVQEHSAPEL